MSRRPRRNTIPLIPSLATLLLLIAPSLARADAAMTELDMLRHAYKTLAFADHDYKGHRVRAMHAIEAACDALGSDIRGDGKGHEPQPTSDAQLKEARSMLDHARIIVNNRHQEVVTRHIEEAIKELDIALTIK